MLKYQHLDTTLLQIKENIGKLMRKEAANGYLSSRVLSIGCGDYATDSETDVAYVVYSIVAALRMSNYNISVFSSSEIIVEKEKSC